MSRYLSFLGLLLFLAYGQSALAATIYFDPGETTVHAGDTIVVAVRINTDQDECINAIDGTINFDPAVRPVDISLGQSIFPLWVEKPTIDRENNQITFAGGIPNGYCGRVAGDPRLTNELFKIVFQVPSLRIGINDDGPTSTISFSDDTKVYLNDGLGTVGSLLKVEGKLIVSSEQGGGVKNEWSPLVRADNLSPQQFSVFLVQNDDVFDGKNYIVFNTTDKQTGIAYYEIMEEPLAEANTFSWGRSDAPWLKAQSPYVLKDQSLNSTIRIKAVDKAGNEYIAVLVPDESQRSISNSKLLTYGVFIVSGIILVLFIFAAYSFWRRRLANKQTAEDEIEDEEEYEEEYEEDEEEYEE